VNIPEEFVSVSSFEFELDGEIHAQETHYNEETKEVILTSPAHSGYPEVTTVLTTKNETHKAKKMTCSDAVCQLNDVLDELNLNPENILNQTSSRKTRKVRADNATTIYAIRSNHELLSSEEFESLPDSMKHVSNRRTIFKSKITLYSELPKSIFSLSTSSKLQKQAKQSCTQKVGCQESINSCTWTFAIDEGWDIGVPFHVQEGDRYCMYCCGNDNSYPDNEHVLCSDMEDTTKTQRKRALVTAIADTAKLLGKWQYTDAEGSVHDHICVPTNHGSYPEYNKECHYFSSKTGTCMAEGETCSLINGEYVLG